jgi:ATP-binding protein involved in chromosome partitioning
MGITEEIVLEKLSHVMDPELHRDLVSLGMIKNVQIENNNVSLTVELTTPACPLKDKIRADVLAALQSIEDIGEINIDVTGRVRSDGQKRELLTAPVKNIIAIASGKGGVGKSTVSVNLAIALAQTGAKVGLLDADIYGPNVPTMMGVQELPPSKSDKIPPAEAYGVKVMSIGFLVKPGQALIWRGPMLHSAIQQFIRDVDWEELDYLVVDLPPGTGDAQLSLAQSISISGGVIVTLPQQVSLDDAERGMQMFQQLNIPILGVVENMSYLILPDGSEMDVFGKGGGQKLADHMNVPLIGTIPMEADVRIGGDSGVPIVISNPDSAAAKALEAIASDVAAKLSVASMQKPTIQLNISD